jgi:hypothetical protein
MEIDAGRPAARPLLTCWRCSIESQIEIMLLIKELLEESESSNNNLI